MLWYGSARLAPSTTCVALHQTRFVHLGLISEGATPLLDSRPKTSAAGLEETGGDGVLRCAAARDARRAMGRPAARRRAGGRGGHGDPGAGRAGAGRARAGRP